MLTFLSIIKSNFALILRLSKRDIESRYKGTFLGILWAVFIPILLLAVYTFVFSEVFQAKWGGNLNGRWDFALVLFCGLVFFNLFSECIGRAPSLILYNSVYVKKVLFPLEILPVVALISALFNFFLSYIVLVIGFIFVNGIPNLGIFIVPFLLIPFSFLILGLSYFLASLGVYIRDLNQIIGVIIMVLMFLSPIFYRIEALPQLYQNIVQISPVTIIIEAARTIMFKDGVHSLNYYLLGGYFLASLIVLYIVFLFFQKTKKGFADVI